MTMIVQGTKLCLTDLGVEDPIIPEWFNFNGIVYDFIPRVKGAAMVDVLNSLIKDRPCLLLLKMRTMVSLLTELSSKDYTTVKKFFDEKSFLVHRKFETLLDIDNSLDKIKMLDEHFSNNNHHLKIDVIADGYPDQTFKNIKMFNFIFSHNPGVAFSARNYYIHSPHFKKEHDKDFLCLASVRPDRPVRKLVADQLSFNNLLDKGFCSFDKKLDDMKDSVGSIHLKNLVWQDGIPSISLYNKVNFEIVCETFGGDLHDSFCLTEKTLKPISMKFPFLLVGTRGFLKKLRELGFQTFDSIIDESYDDEKDHVKRAAMVCEQADKIIKSGSSKFYALTRDICNHNFETLGVLSSKYKEEFWNNMKEKVYPKLF